MANYVFNQLYVMGKPEIVKQFKEQASKVTVVGYEGVKSRPETNASPIHTTIDQPFSMFNLVHPETPEEMEAYVTGDWYDWNVANWGTKWDASEIQPLTDTDSNIGWAFETPWSPPIEFIDKVAMQYPTLRFSLSYEEESGWGGDYVREGGHILESSTYDAPESHKEYVERDQDCPQCGWGDNEYAFDDCPKEEENV